MEIIELNDGVIPFPASELERLKFLPYSLYDEKGFYYSICNGKIYKTSQDIFIESVRLIYNSVQNAKFPKAIKSMEKDRSKNLIQMIKKIPHFQSNRYLQEVETLQKSFIFKQYNDINYLLKKELEGLTKSKFEYVAASEIANHTVYGKTNTSDILFDEFGIKIKKQDGSNFSEDEIKTAEEIIKPVFDFLKLPKTVFEQNHLIISFTHNKTMKNERNAAGIFVTNYKSIGISFSDNGIVLAHELGHWLDFIMGQNIVNCMSFASSANGTMQNVIAFTMRSAMNGNDTKSDYWTNSTECFARSIEEYVSVELFKDESIFSKQYYCNKLNYEQNLKPLIQLILGSIK